MPSPKCPICKQYVERLLHIFTSEAEQAVVDKIRQRHPGWSVYQGMCERCLYLNEFDEAYVGEGFLPDPGFDGLGPSALRSSLFRARVNSEFALLPLPLRLNADPRFRGRGVTIAFIDSGFSLHPDLVKPHNRIKAILDVTDERLPKSYFRQAHEESWHGTMTSVTAAGNGTLSDGMYRGIASEADVVLIKVLNTRTRRISRADILRALRWAIEHAAEYNIRIISMSVYDDEPGGSTDNPVDRVVEEAVQKGIVVVAAVGNNPDRPILPPASSPSAITVGGVDDKNEVWKAFRRMFPSTYGRTADGSAKPDVIAPAIWIAAPILPGTTQFFEAPLLFKLLNASPREAERLLERYRAVVGKISKRSVKGNYKAWARTRIEEMKYVAPYYKHADGTSFAAPIVSAVIAQMLEAHPDLTPAAIKTMLMETAEPLKHASPVQQGSGVLNPRLAVLTALTRGHRDLAPGVHIIDGKILFVYHNRVPRRVAVAGTFNNWNADALRLQESFDGWWSAWMPKPQPGEHLYKFIIDGAVWLEDPANNQKVPDGFGGWNSMLMVN